MSENILKVVYVLFLSIIIALFVGFGISTFYPGPEMPDVGSEGNQAAFDADWDRFDTAHEAYSRNVTVIALGASIVLLAVSLWGGLKNKVIANGILIGGLFVLMYSMGRGFETGDNRLSFATVSVGLVVVLYLGHRRFFPAKTGPSAREQPGLQDPQR